MPASVGQTSSHSVHGCNGTPLSPLELAPKLPPATPDETNQGIPLNNLEEGYLLLGITRAPRD